MNMIKYLINKFIGADEEDEKILELSPLEENVELSTKDLIVERFLSLLREDADSCSIYGPLSTGKTYIFASTPIYEAMKDYFEAHPHTVLGPFVSLFPRRIEFGKCVIFEMEELPGAQYKYVNQEQLKIWLR